MPVIEFRTLGAVDLLGADGRELHSLLAQPKRVALLAYLCIAQPRGFHRRDTLLGLFWPNADQEHARTSLRKALHILRRALGDDAILSRGDEEVAVDFEKVSCDAILFAEHVRANRTSQALEVYRGDLLSGFFVDEAPEFEQWLFMERSKLRALANLAAYAESERQERNGAIADALGLARRALELADTDERALRRVVGLQTRFGDRAAALQVYESFARRLASDFGTKPSAETQSLIAQIRSGQETSVSESKVPATISDIGLSPAPPATKERARLTRTVTATGAVALLAIAAVYLAAHRSDSTLPPRVQRQLTFSGKASTAAISSDGQFLAYVVESRDSLRVVVRDLVGGGRTDTLQSVTDATTIEWSPDGSQLLVGSFDASRNHGLVLLFPRLGGQRRSLSVGDQFNANMRASWLPDSAGAGRISIHDDLDNRVLIVNLRTEDTVPVRVEGKFDWLADGTWSPNGRQIAVVTVSDWVTVWRLLTVSLGGRTQIVTEDTMELGVPRWSPGGDALYYPRGDNAIWRVPVSPRTGRAAGPPTEIVRDVGMFIPSYGLPYFGVTGDGRKIVYAKGAAYSNLWLVTAGPVLRARKLTQGTALRWSPVSSPDGQWVAFAEKSSGASEIFKMPITGGHPTRITFGAGVTPQTSIAWSPDGSQLAFIGERRGIARVWIADVGTGHLRMLERTLALKPTGHLAWAPAGRIAYQGFHANIYLVDPKTGVESTIVTPNAIAWFMSPQYSPDGRSLVAGWNRGPGNLGVWVFDLEGRREPQKIANQWMFPRGWSPDGRYVYARLYSDQTLYRIDTQKPGDPQPLILPTALPRADPNDTPVRQLECSPLGPSNPPKFVCAIFDFVSDIWMIENFDQRGR